MWMDATPNEYIATYDILTNTFISNTYITPTTDDYGSGCLTNIRNEYIVLTGGRTLGTINNKFVILDLNTNNWFDGPNFNQERAVHACVSNRISNRLYVMAGASGSGYVEYIDINDVSNINNYNWVILSDTLTFPYTWRYGPTTAIYNEYIYVMGGKYINIEEDGIDVINTLTNTITYNPSMIPFPTHTTNDGPALSDVARIVTYNKLYLFAGYTLDTYQYASFDEPSMIY